MPRGDKSSYTDKQKRQAEHIEEGYEQRGIPADEAERRAWATVNKETGGGKKSGSGRGKTTSTASARKGGRKAGAGTAQKSGPRKSDGRKTATRKTAGRSSPPTGTRKSSSTASRSRSAATRKTAKAK